MTESFKNGSDEGVLLFDYGGIKWSRCRLKKNMPDMEGGPDLQKGSVAWRPLTNGKQRMMRLGKVPDGAAVFSRVKDASETII